MSSKPLRTFIVCTHPVAVVLTQDTVDVIVPAREHVVRGNEVKGAMIADVGYFQIIHSSGTVAFSAPASTVLWCRVEEDRTFAAIVPIFEDSLDTDTESH